MQNEKEKNSNAVTRPEGTGFYIYIVGVIIITLLLMFNSLTANKLSFDLTNEGNSQGYTLYAPRLSLPKGTYTFKINCEGDFVVSDTDGRMLGKGKGNEIIDVKTAQDESMIIIKGSSDSATNVYIEKKGAIFNDTLVISLMIAAFLIYIGYIHFKKQKELQKSAIYVALIAVAVFASYPIFCDYVSYGHDLNFHLHRIEGIKDGLLSGQFPVRIDPTHNNGYGYITAGIYPGLFLYLPALLRLCGVSLVASYKIFLFAINLATAFIMYFCTKKIAKSNFAGLFSAVVYTLSTWRAENMFLRAAIGETLSMTFFPVVILGLYYILKGDKSKWWVFMLGCSAIFHSHVISCIIVAILVLAMLVIFVRDFIKEKRYIAFIKAVVFTVLINLWYLIPFATYYFGVDLAIRHTPEKREFFSNAIFPAEMFNLFNDKFGSSQLLPQGIPGNMSLSLGICVTFCFVIVVLHFIFQRKKKLEHNDFYFKIFLFAVFIMFMASTLFPMELMQKWKFFNMLVGRIQMPWRFLCLASSIICMVSAAVVAFYVKKDNLKKGTIGLTCLIGAIAFSVFGTAYTTTYGTDLRKGQAAPRGYSAGYDDEYFILGTNKDLLEPEKYTVSGSEIELISYEKNGTNIALELENVSDGDYVEVPLLYYPGYSAKDNRGWGLETVKGDNNVLRIKLTTGTRKVTIKYAGLASFKIGCILSLLTMVCLVAYYIYRRRGERKIKACP